MSDSNEMKNDQKHPRLRLPQAGILAQETLDAGNPLTVDGYNTFMNTVMVDFVNGRISREDAQTIVAIGNSMLKGTALKLKDREMILRYSYKHEQEVQTSDPLLLAHNPKKNGRK